MVRIGLTGMSGSGKSYISGIFREYGIPVINTDAIVHELYAAGSFLAEKLAELFGEKILTPDRGVNRRALSEIVFADPKKLLLLNKTVHPYVKERCRILSDAFAAEGKRAVLIEAPQLFESDLDSECDYIVSTVSPYPLCIERIVARDALSSDEAKRRLANQHDEAFFRSHSDFVIENAESSDLRGQIAAFLQKAGLLA